MGKAVASSSVPRTLPHGQRLVASLLPWSRPAAHPGSPLPWRHLLMGHLHSQRATPCQTAWLTDGPCQGDDHFLAGGLLRHATDDPLDAIHPDLQLHPCGCRPSAVLGHRWTGGLRGEKRNPLSSPSC